MSTPTNGPSSPPQQSGIGATSSSAGSSSTAGDVANVAKTPPIPPTVSAPPSTRSSIPRPTTPITTPAGLPSSTTTSIAASGSSSPNRSISQPMAASTSTRSGNVNVTLGPMVLPFDSPPLTTSTSAGSAFGSGLPPLPPSASSTASAAAAIINGSSSHHQGSLYRVSSSSRLRSPSPLPTPASPIITKMKAAIEEKKVFYSFEFFPPKTTEGVNNLYVRLDRMSMMVFIRCIPHVRPHAVVAA
jgi:hypothetical protein